MPEVKERNKHKKHTYMKYLCNKSHENWIIYIKECNIANSKEEENRKIIGEDT